MDARLLLQAGLRFAAGLALLAALLFGSAGTLDFPAAWRYLGLLALLVAIAFATLLRRDPDLLRRRIEAREIEPVQRRVVAFGTVVFVVFFALPGLDRRFGWSAVPPGLEIASLAGVALGYGGFLRVLRANRWAARTIGVAAGQAVVSTGPYARVRHPMYAAMLVMYAFTPTALGSWAATPLPLAILAFLVPRIRNEEEVLRRDLPGYEEYTRSVRWRLVPGVW